MQTLRSANATDPSARALQTAAVDRELAARYVLSRRTAYGGYSYYREPEWGVEEPNAPDTLAALLSLRYLGVVAPAREQTVNWLRGLQDDSGGYPTLTIGWATLRALTVTNSSPLRSARDWIAHHASALARADVDRDARGALRNALHLIEVAATEDVVDLPYNYLLRLLSDTKDPSGGWSLPGPDLETTHVAWRLARCMGTSTHEACLRQFLFRCEDPIFGYLLQPAARVTSVGALAAGVELAHALSERPRYPMAVSLQLGLLQRPDGGFGARHHAVSTLRDTQAGLEADGLLTRFKEGSDEHPIHPVLRRLGHC